MSAIGAVRLGIIGALALGLTACGTTSGLKKPLADFSDASSKTIEATRPYFADINANAQTYAFDRAFADPNRRLADDTACDPEAKAAPAAGGAAPFCFTTSTFKEANVEAVLGTLDAAKGYAEILGKLAADDAVKDGQDQAAALGEKLGKLSDNLVAANVLGESYGPLGGLLKSVATAIGKAAVERERTKAIRIAVNEGYPPLDKALETIAPLARQAANQQRNFLRGSFLELSAAYDSRMKAAPGRPFTEAERMMLLERAERVQAKLREFPDDDPSAVIAKMRTAHKALNDAVLAGPKASPAAFRDAVIAYSEAATTFADAVAEYRAAKKKAEEE